MSTSDLFKTLAEMDSAGEFVQFLEQLLSGTPASTGTNRPLGQLAENDDALLDVVQAHRQRFFTHTGDVSWASGSLSFASDLTIRMVHELGGAVTNVIAVASSPVAIAAGGVAYVQLDRGTDAAVLPVLTAATLAAFLAAITGSADRLDFQIIAYRQAGNVILWDGRRLRDGETLSNAGYTDTQYGQQTELTAVHENQKENLNLILAGGGSITYDAGADTMAWDASFFWQMAASAGDNFLDTSSSPLTILAGQVAYVTLTRDPGSSVDISGTLTVVNDNALPDTDDVYVLAYRDSTDDRLYLGDGTSLSDGDTVLLGGIRSGLQWMYKSAGTGSQTTDFTAGGSFPSRKYQVGTGELMVYRNGVKAKAAGDPTSPVFWSGGTHPAGALSGSLDDDDEYVEADDGDGTGTYVIWLRDDDAAPSGESPIHAYGTHVPPFSYPTSDDNVEAFIGLQGDGPSPVEGIGRVDTGDVIDSTVLEGIVRLEEGNGITLTHRPARNAWEISANVSAGVASLQDPDGPAVPRTGVVKLRGGNKITLDNVSNADEFLFDNDVDDLVDLDNVSSDLQAAIVGSHLPTATAPLVSTAALPPLLGFDQIWTETDTELRILGGWVQFDGVPYYWPASTYSAENLISGLFDEPYAGTGWYYLYVRAGTSPGGIPRFKLSATAPLVGGLKSGDPTRRFLASVYIQGSFIGSAYFTMFAKRGSFTHIQDPIDIDSAFSGAVFDDTYQSVDLSAHIPVSGVRTLKLKLDMRPNSTPGNDLRILHKTPGNTDAQSSIYHSYSGAERASYIFETLIDSGKVVEFAFDTDFATLEAARIIGYSEGILAVGSGL